MLFPQSIVQNFHPFLWGRWSADITVCCRNQCVQIQKDKLLEKHFAPLEAIYRVVVAKTLSRLCLLLRKPFK